MSLFIPLVSSDEFGPAIFTRKFRVNLNYLYVLCVVLIKDIQYKIFVSKEMTKEDETELSCLLRDVLAVSSLPTHC
jgi:hypothetical protein